MDLTPFKNCLAHQHGLYISNETKPYMPCCWFKPGVSATTYSEYQSKLSEVDIATGCQHCIDQESAGATWSHRQLFKDVNELVIGVCFDNLCNIKCITCNPYYSSQHISEWEKLDKFNVRGLTKKYFTTMLDQGSSKLAMIEDTISNSSFSKLRLEIFGGEPLINPVVLKFIAWLAASDYAGITELVITTNGTTSLRVIESELQHFKRVLIQFSVDGVDEVFDSMRYGANFDKMKGNVDHFRALTQLHDNLNYGFNFTLSWLNADSFLPYYNWLLLNYIDTDSLHLTKLDRPEHYAVNLLPESQRDSLLALLPQSAPNQQFQRLLDLYKESLQFTINIDTALLGQGINELKKLVTVRNHNEHIQRLIDKYQAHPAE